MTHGEPRRFDLDVSDGDAEEILRVKLLLATGEIEEVAIVPSSSPPWTLKFSGRGAADLAFAGSDLFEALIALRRHLEAEGSRLLCAGARRDVYPSGMARSMGSARKAYILEMGKQAHVLVDIFSDADSAQIGAVQDQEDFCNEWFAALESKAI